MKGVSLCWISGESFKGGLRVGNKTSLSCRPQGHTLPTDLWLCTQVPTAHTLGNPGCCLRETFGPVLLAKRTLCLMVLFCYKSLALRLFRCLALFLLLQELPIQNCLFYTGSYFHSFLRGLVGEGLVPLSIRSTWNVSSCLSVTVLFWPLGVRLPPHIRSTSLPANPKLCVPHIFDLTRMMLV